MNTYRVILISVLVCGALASVSCAPAGSGLAGAIPGSGNVQTERRDTGAFHAVLVEYPADITIQQGQEDSVEIEAEDNLLPQLSTVVSSGKLTIKTAVTDRAGRVNPSKAVKIHITMQDPTEIEFAAPAGSLEMNGVRAPMLKLVLSGAGMLRLNRIQVDAFDGTLSGAGDVQVTGIAQEIKLVLSGLGNFDAAELKSHRASVELSGMGDVVVRVEAELNARVSGSGAVSYFGTPRVEQVVTGAGSVKSAEQTN